MGGLSRVCGCLLSLLAGGDLVAEPFAYQAYVEFQGRPLEGTRDLRFRMYATSSAGVPLTTALSFDDWPVQRGVVDVPLDFGPVFNGSPRWLEIEIDGSTLSPRQRVMATPVSLVSLSGGTPALLAGLPQTASLTITTGPQNSGIGVRLAEAFELTQPPTGPLQAGTLVLRRPVSDDLSWRNWQAQRNTNIVVLMRIAIGNGSVLWRFDNGFAQGWELTIADDGLPIEQVRLRFAPAGITRSHDIAVPSGPPSAARLRGFVSGQPAGTAYLVRWQGTDQATWRVLDDRSRSYPVTVNGGVPTPAGADALTGLWLRVNGTAGNDLFNSLQTSSSRALRLTLGTRILLDGTQARVSALRLMPSDDGYWVEDYRVDTP